MHRNYALIPLVFFGLVFAGAFGVRLALADSIVTWTFNGTNTVTANFSGLVAGGADFEPGHPFWIACGDPNSDAVGFSETSGSEAVTNAGGGGTFSCDLNAYNLAGDTVALQGRSPTLSFGSVFPLVATVDGLLTAAMDAVTGYFGDNIGLVIAVVVGVVVFVWLLVLAFRSFGIRKPGRIT